jgi:hypothetical protein
LHHDTAHPHAAATTIETIQNLKYRVLPHPLYSPDLTPSNCNAFSPLKEELHGHWFSNDEEVKEAMHTWFWEQPKTCFSNGIRKLVDRYKKYVELQGDYVEN